MGVLALYMLIGQVFAFIYGAIDQLGDTPLFAGGDTATVSHCIYFSFTTLTTVGYGDFVTATDVGHTLAVFEALLGQIYLVTVVSLLVGNLGRRRPGAAAEREPGRRRRRALRQAASALRLSCSYSASVDRAAVEQVLGAARSRAGRRRPGRRRATRRMRCVDLGLLGRRCPALRRSAMSLPCAIR